MGALKRKLVMAMACMAVMLGVVVASPAAAQAAPAAVCHYSMGPSFAGGGCDHNVYITTRMVLTCEAIGSDFRYTVYSAWYSGQWICWGAWLFCHGGTGQAKEVRFEAK